MKNLTMILLLTCVCLQGQAQVNFVKNPGLERYDTCPNTINRINWCEHWSIPGDSTTTREYCLEYYNACGNDSLDVTAHVPVNIYFYGYPHSGNGMAGSVLYYDKTHPSVSYWPFNYRDNLVGRLHSNLIAGKTYCVSFWVVMAESSGYAHNKIGAYLDDGSINIVDTFGEEKSDLKPQVFTNEVIIDTLNWTKIEGNFTATGTEKYISIGNFFPNDSITKIATNYRGFLPQHSYYLIDDVSVIPIDLDANAGKDSHVAPGQPIKIGHVGDTTAQGLDCKWYHKGALIDSSAIIIVNGSSIVGTVDTYVVVQTICGLVKTDTVTVKTVPVGIKEWNTDNTFIVYPNPSNGTFTITSTAVIQNATQRNEGSLHAVVYDLLGRSVYKQIVLFNNGSSSIEVNTAAGIYILELSDEEGNTTHQRIVIE